MNSRVIGYTFGRVPTWLLVHHARAVGLAGGSDHRATASRAGASRVARSRSGAAYASLNEGNGWIISATTSTGTRAWIASAATPIHASAPGPMAPAPTRTRRVRSATRTRQPAAGSSAASVIERAVSAGSADDTSTSSPRSLAAPTVMPAEATGGWV